MDVGALQPLISATPLADVAACRAELVAITMVRGVLDARELEVVRRLDELAQTDGALFPQEVVARASRSSLSAAERLRDRATAAENVPELGAALAAGSTTGDRLDVVARAAAGLSADEKAALAGHGARLALAAGSQTPAELRTTVDDVVRRVRADDELGKLARQRRMARLRWWLDGDGMWNLAGRFDPVAGLRLEGRLRNEVDRLRAAGVPAEAPTDPLDRQQYLAAQALIGVLCPSELIGGVAPDQSDEDDPSAPTAATSPRPSPTAPAGPQSSTGGTGGSGVPDVTVLIDARTLLTGEPHDGTVCETGLGRFGLPIETVRRWACLGGVTPIVVAADGVRLFLGRETRLANRAQRRALRALYRSCSLCDVPFDHCQVHHVGWYTLGGFTDVENLLPLCNRHHHLVHEGGWVLHLAPDRSLAVTRPGGSVSTHPPPRARAA